MANTKEGGIKVGKTNKEKYDAIYMKKYGKTFYEYIGYMGGKKGKTGGFWHAKYVLGNNLPTEAGRLGGKKSRKPKA